MRLDGEQHRVLRPGVAAVGVGAHARRMQLAAVVLDQAKAVLLDRQQVAVAGDEGDVFARKGEPRPEQAADRAGADDGDLHSAA